MDPLIEIPREQWSHLLKLFEEDWPQGAVAYCLLDTHIKNLTLSLIFKFRVFCPDGNYAFGMVAMTEMDNSNFHLFVQPLRGNMSKLKESLLKTNLINWKREFYLASACDDVIICLDDIKQAKGVIFVREGPAAIKHVLNKDSEMFDVSTLPLNTYVGRLKPEDIEFVATKWTYFNESSHIFFKILSDNNLTYVLYSCEDKPLTWITVNESGALTHLFCVEDQRKKGYAEFITKYAANDMLKQGKVVLGYTLKGNTKAENLFLKLKFKTIGSDFWVRVIQDK